MGNLPTEEAKVVWTSQPNPGGQGNVETNDILHILGTDGSIDAWIDATGTGQGNLKGGGGGSTVVSVKGTPVPNPNFVEGSNVTLTPVGSNVTITAASQNTVVKSDGTTVPNPNFVSGTNVTLTPSGSNITVSASGAQGPAGPPGPPGASNVPWQDIQQFGSVPKALVFNQPTASCTTTAGSNHVTISSGTFASTLTNGQGVCIWKAGSPTTQSTPVAPVVTSPVVQGGQTLTYQLVGYDSKGGLTAASASGTVTNAPAVFGPLPVQISSISAAAGVVTINLSAPLNNTVTAGMTLHVTGVTGAGSTWNGIWTIQSVTNTQSVTYNVSGATGTGTVGASSTGRVSNSAIITAISRDATGVVTVTTAQNHNFQMNTVNSSRNPTVVVIEGVTEQMIGNFIIASIPTSNTFTYASGVRSALTGGVITGAATATVWEFTNVMGPALSGTTVGYYIYSDSPSPGGALQLIGRTYLGEKTFQDWGPTIASGYRAPGYVPTSPPASSQNQMFTSTVSSGAGSTNLNLAANVISGASTTILFDDGPNLVAAANVLAGSSNIGASVLISPPTTATSFPGYIFNSPITIPENINVTFAAKCIINETITFTAFNQVNALFGPGFTQASPGFSELNFGDLSGLGNPMINVGENIGNSGSVKIDGLCFTVSVNGLVGLQVTNGFYTTVSNCAFSSSTNNGNAVGLMYMGNCSLVEIADCTFSLVNRFFGNGVPGQSGWGPSLPSVWFRSTSNNIAGDDGSGLIVFRGKNTGEGRGILFDQGWSASGNNNPQGVSMYGMWWLQQATTPSFMFWGQIFSGIRLSQVLNDTSQEAVLANWANQSCSDVFIYSSSTASSAPTVTGAPITRLYMSNSTSQYQSQLSNLTGVSFTSTSATQDVVSFPNYSGGQLSLVPTNSSAALDVASGLAFISGKSFGTVTITHSATSGMTFDIMGTA